MPSLKINGYMQMDVYIQTQTTNNGLKWLWNSYSIPATTETAHCAFELHKDMSVSLKHILISLTRARAYARKRWHQWPICGKAHDKHGFTALWVLFGRDFLTAVSPKSKYLGNPRASKKSLAKNKGFARHQLNPCKKQSTHLDQIWTPCWTEAGFSSA